VKFHAQETHAADLWHLQENLTCPKAVIVTVLHIDFSFGHLLGGG